MSLSQPTPQSISLTGLTNVLFHLHHIINLVLFTVDICFDQTISDIDLLFGLFGTIDLNLEMNAERDNCQRYHDVFSFLATFHGIQIKCSHKIGNLLILGGGLHHQFGTERKL